MHLIRLGKVDELIPAGALQVSTFCELELVVDLEAWLSGLSGVTYDPTRVTCSRCSAGGDLELEGKGPTWGTA